MISRAELVISTLGGTQPHMDAFIKNNSFRLMQLCQDGWMLRLVEVSCKEQGTAGLMRDLMLKHRLP